MLEKSDKQGVCNLNDYPTGVVPVTRVDPAVDVAYSRESYYDHAFDKENWERCSSFFFPLLPSVSSSSLLSLIDVSLTPPTRTDDPAYFANAPVGVQVAGRKGEDEAVIRMTEIVDAALKAAKKA